MIFSSFIPTLRLPVFKKQNTYKINEFFLVRKVGFCKKKLWLKLFIGVGSRSWGKKTRNRSETDRLRNTVYDYGYNMTNWLSVTTKGGQTEQE